MRDKGEENIPARAALKNRRHKLARMRDRYVAQYVKETAANG